MYDQLYFLLSWLQPMCWEADMPMLPWAAIAMADFVRGITTAADFQAFMNIIGVVDGYNYSEIAQCVVRA
ncbi:MAG: hypothetical protein GWN58_19845, partial [Anaerolineae bacterium]|nr:hypothetical protein [Anaerolineae bacterium]